MATKARPARQAAPQANLNWFDDAIEAPRAGTVDTRRLERRQRLIRWYVWGAVVGAPFLALLALASASHGGGSSAISGASSPPGAELTAWQSAQTWLGQSPSPLPRGHIVTWEDATPVPSVVPPKGESGPPEEAWDERFLAETPQSWYYLDVEVVSTGTGQWAPVATPSVLQAPSSAATSGASVSPWPRLSASSNVPAPVSNSIGSWLAAYTSGDPQALLQATGDPSTADAYVPLRGVRSASVAGVVAAANYGPPGQMIVEAQFYVTWDGQSPMAVSGQQEPMTMDLLVERATTATPVVVAWGPPGSGPSLRPYQNAVPVSTGS